MLGFEGKKEIIKGEKAKEVLSSLSRVVSRKPSTDDLKVEKTIREARKTYSVEWKN